jgi:hypothetical protein
MARTRHVFPTSEIPHLWANDQDGKTDARNGQGNLYFYDGRIYSYGSHFMIARWTEVRNGARAVLFNSDTYSVTTSKHQSAVRRSIPSIVPVFTVPCRQTPRQPRHKVNLRHYRQEIAVCVVKAKRARSNTEWLHGQAVALCAEANRYAEFFRLKTRFTLPDGEAIAERIKAQKQTAKRKATRDLLKLERQRAIFLTETLPEWRAGVGMATLYRPVGWRPSGWSRTPWVALRIKGDNVETTMGASVPTDHAEKIIGMVQAIQSGRRAPYARNGHSIHLGAYVINRIDADGTVRAGCHVIPFSEVQYIAGLLQKNGATAAALSLAG